MPDKSQTSALITSEEELIDLMNKHLIDPDTAVKKYPMNEAIVKAAYHLKASSIKYADIHVINQLGQNGNIKVEDILEVFSKEMPTQNEINETDRLYSSAVSKKEWEKISKILNQFWFERPNISKEKLEEMLVVNKQWEDLYQFQKAIHKEENYILTEGPLNKSEETRQLEEIVRRMMQYDDFQIKSEGEEDYIIFDDDTRFNWSKIQKNANWQHIDFTEDDFENYKIFMEVSGQEESCDLERDKESEYQKALYTDPITGKENIPQDESDVIKFEEMQAINLYTSSLYKEMNGLIRGDLDSFNYKKYNSESVRSVFTQCAMASSGLRKIPITTIPKSYRGEEMSRNEMQKNADRIEAVTTGRPIKATGFVSSTINAKDKKYTKLPILYTLTNLKGVYVEPITKSKELNEQEFLIPSDTFMRIDKYEFKNGQHQFDCSLVSDLKNEFEPFVLECPTEAMIEHIEKEDFPPWRAIALFPDHQEIVSAALSKDPKLLETLPIKTVVMLLKAEKISPIDAHNAFKNNPEIAAEIKTLCILDLLKHNILMLKNASGGKNDINTLGPIPKKMILSAKQAGLEAAFKQKHIKVNFQADGNDRKNILKKYPASLIDEINLTINREIQGYYRQNIQSLEPANKEPNITNSMKQLP